jgi:nickel-dependent lactate racemase
MDGMMHVSVDYHDERLELDVEPDRVVALWSGPKGLDPPADLVAIRDALEQPWAFPPLRQLVVPGDRVTIVFDSTIGPGQFVLEVVGRILQESGVEPDDLTVLAPSAVRFPLENAAWQGAKLVVHDSQDRGQLAYLAATKQGRRIYLNRFLTDADVVIPIGRLGYDPIMGYRGPWSVIFPESGEQAAIDTHRGRFRDDGDNLESALLSANLDESLEVSWLLGSQFHVGVVPGRSGIVEVVAGREHAVRERGITAVKSAWRFNAPARAEMVVVGIGGPGVATTFADLAAGLATASRLVQHGGKIVALSRIQGTIGPAVSRLVDIDDSKVRAAALRGHEADHDFVAARRLVQALEWADVFVLTGMAAEVVESLSLASLESAEQARRLVAKSGSCSFVSHAELTRAEIREEDETRNDDDSE